LSYLFKPNIARRNLNPAPAPNCDKDGRAIPVPPLLIAERKNWVKIINISYVSYAYLAGSLAMLFIWLILYLLRKDTRREMWALGIYSGIASLIASWLWWTKDWWFPPNIMNTRVGIEDFIIGFSCGGIAAVIYEEVFKKDFVRAVGKSTRSGSRFFPFL